MDKRIFDYVKKFFRNKFPEKCVMMENEEINNIVMEVCKELKVYERNQILESKVDDLIFDMLHNIGKKNRNKLWNDTLNLENHISKFVIDSGLSKQSNGITNYIVKKIVVKLIPYYNLSKLNKGYFDNQIKVSFIEYRKNLFEEIYKIIYGKLVNTDIMGPGLKNDQIAKDLTIYLIEQGSYDLLDDLKNNKYDQLINSYVSKIVRGVESKKKEISKMEIKSVDPVYYISNYIIENLDVNRVLSYDEINECANYINHRLSVPTKNRDRGLTPEEIISPLNGSEILKYYNRYMMKRESMVKDNVPKRVKPKKKRRFLQRGIATLLLIGALAGVFGTGAVILDKGLEKYKESVSSFAVEFSSPIALGEFDDYGYTYIFHKGNDAVKPTALNALDFHSKVQDGGYNNSNYDYLGFYRAYENVRDDRLYIMDTMLSIVKDEVIKKESGTEFQKNISSASCYLEFAMDRLEDMGYEDIKDQKYHNALFSYLMAKSEHPGKEPLQYMNNSDRKIVESIMEKYQSYSDKLLKEFGEIIQEEKSGLISLSVLSGRGM